MNYRCACGTPQRIHAIKISLFITRKQVHLARCKYIWKRWNRSEIGKRGKYYPISSTPKPHEITIKFENEIEDKIILNKTGKLSINKKCTIITSHVTLRIQKAIATKEIQAYVSTFNLTLEYKSSNENKKQNKNCEKN